MSISMSTNRFLPSRGDRSLLIKWVLALLVPIVVFNFVWQGDSLINNVVLGFINPSTALVSSGQLVEAVIFILILYLTVFGLAGYLVAADSGKRGIIEVWADMLLFAVIPILLISVTNNLVIGLALCAIIWPIYFLIRRRLNLFPSTKYVPKVESLLVDNEQKATMLRRARMSGFWYGTLLAVIWLIVDLIFFASGQLPTSLLMITVARSVLFPIGGYFLGGLGGRVAVNLTLSRNGNGNGAENGTSNSRAASRRQRLLKELATSRASEETKEIVPNDLPLRSSGARRFFLILLVAFVIFYPVIDPFLFSYGTIGRIAGFNDAGYYVILALGLNIVVGFAGLLDLGYVAFFAIGAYAWGIFGSRQFGIIFNGLFIDPRVLSWLFWPMLLVVALIAALFGILLGAPTLRLRGDYLAIVTLGFGEIVPVIFLNLNNITNGTNGIVGVNSPSFFGVNWSQVTPVPYYYLILALIGLVILANVRLRDSRLGRAWIAIREDEIAAASSGINLVRTKLFAFAAGAFFSGIAGAYFSAKLGGVSPDLFSFNDSVIYLAMVVIGGLGSIPGVIVGALTVYSINLFILNQLDSLASDPTSFMYGINQFIVHIIPTFTFGNIRELVFGMILVTIMIFRPEGLIPSARRRRELHRDPDEGAMELGSLDVMPTEPGFEAEVRIE